VEEVQEILATGQKPSICHYTQLTVAINVLRIILEFGL
jgi:hypothetical protein